MEPKDDLTKFGKVCYCIGVCLFVFFAMSWHYWLRPLTATEAAEQKKNQSEIKKADEKARQSGTYIPGRF